MPKSNNKTMKRCKKFVKKETKRKLKIISNMFTKKLKQKLPKDMKVGIEKKLNLLLCNPGCKNTILEPGKSTYVSKEIEKGMKKIFKDKKLANGMINIVRATRKKIFGKQKNVLDKNNMYKKASKIDKKYLKKNGALSYCVPQPYNMV